MNSNGKPITKQNGDMNSAAAREKYGVCMTTISNRARKSVIRTPSSGSNIVYREGVHVFYKKSWLDQEFGGSKVVVDSPVQQTMDFGRGNSSDVKSSVAGIVDDFCNNKEYFETRLGMLNRRACLHRGASCAFRARSEISGMLSVLNALGYEARGDWDRYDSEFDLVPAECFNID